MKINYLQESVFGSYKNKTQDKLKNIKQETARISNKWFQENVVPKILDYYIPKVLEFSNTICKQERGIEILCDRNSAVPKNDGAVVDIKEENGKILIKQYLVYKDISSYNNLYFLKNETFEIFDEIEDYISKNFGECKIILTIAKIINGNKWFNFYDSAKHDLVEIPFLQDPSNDYPIIEIIISNKEMTSLDKVFNFFNRFENALPILPSLNLASCNNLTSFDSKIPLKSFKIGRIFLWGGANLTSFKGWQKFMVDDDPKVIYNVNSILDSTAASHVRYEIKKEFDVDKPAFELATNGKIPKKYLLYLSEIKRRQLENYNRALKTHKSEDDVEDLDVEGAKINYLEYHLKTEKVKQYDHDPLTFIGFAKIK